jgi:hypothetical protein
VGRNYASHSAKRFWPKSPKRPCPLAFQLFAEFGRTLEQIGADLDRIATTLENQQVEISGPAEPPVLDL